MMITAKCLSVEPEEPYLNEVIHSGEFQLEAVLLLRSDDGEAGDTTIRE